MPADKTKNTELNLWIPVDMKRRLDEARFEGRWESLSALVRALLAHGLELEMIKHRETT